MKKYCHGHQTYRKSSTFRPWWSLQGMAASLAEQNCWRGCWGLSFQRIGFVLSGIICRKARLDLVRKPPHVGFFPTNLEICGASWCCLILFFWLFAEDGTICWSAKTQELTGEELERHDQFLKAKEDLTGVWWVKLNKGSAKRISES
jgi:hypothetical protein